MCTVTININESVVQDLFPELDTLAAIRQWAQSELDRRIEELNANEETMDIEEARRMVHETVRKEYALI